MSVSLGLFATGLLALSMGISSLQPQRSIDVGRLDNTVIDSWIIQTGFDYATIPFGNLGNSMDTGYDQWWYVSGFKFGDGYKLNPVPTFTYDYYLDDDDGYLSFYNYLDTYLYEDYSLQYSDWINSFYNYTNSYNNNSYKLCSNHHLFNFYTLLNEWLQFDTDSYNYAVTSFNLTDFIVFRYFFNNQMDDEYDIITGLIYKPTNKYPITFFVDNYLDKNFPYLLEYYNGMDTLFYDSTVNNYEVLPTAMYRNYTISGGINPQSNYEDYYSSISNNVNPNSDVGFGAYQRTNDSATARENLGNQRIHTEVSYNGMDIGSTTSYYESTFTYARCIYDTEVITTLFGKNAVYGYVVNRFAYEYSDDFTAIAQDNYNRGYEDGRTVGLTQGYDNGYNRGYADGVAGGGNATFIGLFGSIADTPILMIRSLFDFDLFGINMLTVVLSLTTGLIVMFLIRKFI